MLAATQVKKSGGEKKVNRTTYKVFSIKRVSRTFLEVSRCRLAKQRQRNVQKKCAARKCKVVVVVFFANWTYCFFFAVFVAVAAWLA